MDVAALCSRCKRLISGNEGTSDFVVTPGATEALYRYGVESPVPMLPGVSTISELMTGWQYGYRRFKFFPAESSGGAKAIKAFGAPIPEARFCPTGGITVDNAESYLSLPNVMCVGGSWLTERSLLQAGAGARAIPAHALIFGGEALPAEAQAQVFARLPGAGLYNLYGPTEAAVDAAIVGHLATAIGVQDDLDASRMAGQRLVHRVVDDFLRQVVGARGVGVHAGPALDRVKAGKDFDVGGVVTTAHGVCGVSAGRCGARQGVAGGWIVVIVARETLAVPSVAPWRQHAVRRRTGHGKCIRHPLSGASGCGSVPPAPDFRHVQSHRLKLRAWTGTPLGSPPGAPRFPLSTRSLAMKSRNLLLLSAAAVGALFAVQAFAQSKTATDADKPKQDQSQTSDPSDPEAKARRRAANEAAAKQRRAAEGQQKKAGEEEEERKP